MPELPEVETTIRGLRLRMEGERLTRADPMRPNLRFPFPKDLAVRLTGRRIERIDRRAKYMLFHTDDGQVLIGHLGMSGRMRLLDMREDLPPLEKHDHLVFETAGGWQIRFNDARRFGFFDLTTETALAAHPHLADLGPEPLGNAFNGPALALALKGRRTPIKAALLDQRVVAGLGNIYVCEALHLAGLSPRRQAYTVQGARAERLAAAVRAVLTQAIADGGSSLRDFVHPDGELGYFKTRFRVYDREGLACLEDPKHGPVCRIVQSGRSTFYCPRCQR